MARQPVPRPVPETMIKRLFQDIALVSAGRRPSALLAAVLAAIALPLLAACAPAPPPDGTTPGPADLTRRPEAAPTVPPGPTGVPTLSKAYKLSLATSGSSETYSSFGKALATLWSSSIQGLTVSAEATGASVAGLRSLQARQMELALAQGDILEYAWNGQEMFDRRVDNVRAVANLYPLYVQWLVDDRVISSVGQFRGAVVAVGPPGSGSDVNTRQILEQAGLVYEDLAKALFLSSSEAADLFKIQQLDALCLTDGLPSPAIEAANAASFAWMLPITADLAQRVTTRYKGLSRAVLPAGVYKGIDKDVPTLATRAVLVARDDLDSSLVYWLAKTLVEKQPELAKLHPLGREIAAGTVPSGPPVPLHSGAERYYKDAGILK